MDGIGIQLLDGVEHKDIQFLDGRAKRRQRRSMLANFTPEQRAEFLKQTKGFTAQIADDTDTVINGLDFAGFSGDGSIEDDEMAYNYLVRTKNIVDNSPQVIAGYNDPSLFSKMLGYVLDNWDTANREFAINRMADEESDLIAKGKIQPSEGEYEYLSSDESIDIEDYSVGNSGMVRKKAFKNGFFNNLKRTTTASIAENAAEVVSSNPLLYKRKNAIRKATEKGRSKKNKTVANSSGIVKTISQHTSDTTSVNGLFGFGDDEYEAEYTAVERGYDMAGLFGSFTSEEEDLEGLKNYLVRTRKLVASRPEDYFKSEKEAQINISGLDHMIINFDDPVLREKSIQEVSSNQSLLGNVENVDMPISELAGALGANIFKKAGKAIKKTTKKVAKGVKKASTAVAKGVKKAATAVAKVATKFWAGVKKVAKKVWKVIVKYNPLTIAARAGLLLAANLNMFHLGSKLYVGFISETEAKKLGYTTEQWKKAVAASAKAGKIYTNIGGNLDKLKGAATKGARKVWKGAEMPSSNKKEFTSQVTSTIDANPEMAKAAVSEYDSENAKLKASGAQVDHSVDPNKGVVSTKVETTVEVFVDKNGKELSAAEIEQAKKEGSLKGVYEIDAPTASIVHGLINNETNCLGELATFTIITAAIGLITSILKVLADSGIGGKAVKNISKVATVAYSAAQGANDINQSLAIKKLQESSIPATKSTPTAQSSKQQVVNKTSALKKLQENTPATKSTPTAQSTKQQVVNKTSALKNLITSSINNDINNESGESDFTDLVNNATQKVQSNLDTVQKVQSTVKKLKTGLNTAEKLINSQTASSNTPTVSSEPITVKENTTTTAGLGNFKELLPYGIAAFGLLLIPIAINSKNN